MQKQLDEGSLDLNFAIMIFDCNDLKGVNDNNGHDKGDIYLKKSAEAICDVFNHSPVFRIGGDEFALIMSGSDFKKRDELIKLFDEKCAEIRKQEKDIWDKVDLARGIAVYDPKEDESVSEVFRRADKLMYENKFETKRSRQTEKV